MTTRLRSGRKGDVSTDLILVEAKTTDKASISIKQAHLIKITREANDHVPRKSPMMVISFPVMPDGVSEDWVMVPIEVFKKLQEKNRGE